MTTLQQRTVFQIIMTVCGQTFSFAIYLSVYFASTDKLKVVKAVNYFVQLGIAIEGLDRQAER